VETENNKIVDSIFRVMDAMLFMEKRLSMTFQGVTLYPKEVHMLLYISKNNAVNAKMIAEAFAITKGAVSQTIGRLVDKNMIIKKRNPASPKELMLTLSARGQAASEHAMQFKQDMADKYDSYLANLPDRDKDVISEFLVRMEKVLKAV